MRILQFIETGGPGGAETVFSQLSSGLSSRGHHVACITGNGNWLPAEIERRGLQLELRNYGGSFDTQLLRQIRARIRRDRIDVVHAHLFSAAAYAALAAKLSGVPCIVTLHGQVDVKHGSRTTRIKAAIIRRCARYVVAVSAALRDDLQDALRIPIDRFRVIYNGLERETGSNKFPDRQPHNSAGFRLVALGNIRPSKGYVDLLNALAILARSSPDFHLDILGQPDSNGLYESLLRQSQTLGLQERITFHGFVSNPAPFLNSADCFVLPSSTEGFSLATVEAMLAGVPVVATRSGGPQEIVREEETGILVEPRNPEQLAAAILRVMNDSAMARRFAQAAYNDANEKFSIGRMIDSYEQLYRETTSKE